MNSMYNFLVNNGVKVSQKIWHMKLPPKIKIFLRYLKKGIILTKDNLAGGIRMEVRFLVIVANRKQSNIFFYCYYANFL